MRAPRPLFPALLFATVWLAAPATAQSPPPVRGYLNDSALALLKPLIGRWRPTTVLNPSAYPPGTTIVAEDYRWTVAGKAIRYRENYPLPLVDSANVDGLIYWNPATERVEFVGVSGRGVGQGHLYLGEYHLLADGTVERVFEGFYRTLDDVPGDSYGGLRRRYRQKFTFFTPDSVGFVLEWFHDGAWRPLGQFARNTLVRIPE
jgi:hypothetical protein